MALDQGGLIFHDPLSGANHDFDVMGVGQI